MSKRLNKLTKHEKTLAADIGKAIDDMDVDVILLRECGEIEIGLDSKQWLELLQDLWTGLRPLQARPLNGHREAGNDGDNGGADTERSHGVRAESWISEMPAPASAC